MARMPQDTARIDAKKQLDLVDPTGVQRREMEHESPMAKSSHAACARCVLTLSHTMCTAPFGWAYRATSGQTRRKTGKGDRV